ncbi:hypothetical protein G9A89_006710 [Geosiphon pyriformis]|nr:hypothetical protein G9A89_006710 [Geosiphon pyriformis]
MDGFLCNLESVDMKAGAAAFFEDINLGLEVEVTGMVSSTLVELQTIALALKCVPSLSSVCLFSDSQAALDACWLLSFWLKECFVLTNNSIVSGNFRHFVHNVFQSIHYACWELGFGAKIVDSCLLTDIDWFKLFLVWHLDSHMAAGFMSRHSVGSHSYFMKALHHRLPVAVHKCLYNKCYPSVVCLYCGNVKVSDHVFFCVFDTTAQLQLFIDFASAWKAVSGLFHVSSYVLQMLSNCLADLELVALLYKDFMLVDWY